MMALLRKAVYKHLHVDWYLPGEWIGHPGFVVKPVAPKTGAGSITSKLLGVREQFAGCLAATPDPEPVAWVRVAAIEQREEARETLAQLVAGAVRQLQDTAVTMIAWLAIEDWPNLWLAEFGFDCENHIETYVKEDRALPAVEPVPGLEIRSVREQDIDALAKLEAAAFAPLWRHSARGLRMARSQSLSFDVAVLNGRLAGFQLSTPSRHGAHLVRLTVDPALHGAGIGSALLAYACEGYYRRGKTQITLNTQVDNAASQRLYRKFGFRASGQQFPVWVMGIE